ncbi:aminotransferase class IV family protein [Desulfotalea psychrophila]|uniref:4-amino-4-deoxychorismate lyase n=1 Tax=Desulfotalea psychrophila (strain LSv54 / DSM 12343) TaxID=177439 RepID=Q6APW9_DESPS|nr:aminotransferase class IV family protein [Desulfotalea psychrophila]CAG35604.1 conserved hypothetical protein [Desulfotalea psychrophila LSv54]
MFPLVETVQVVDGEALHLNYHQKRLDATFHSYYQAESPFTLAEIIHIPRKFSKGLHKLRFLYDQTNYRYEFSPYQARRIESLKIVEVETIHYPFKFTDRQAINELVSQKGQCDDILIVVDGLIGDTSIANIVFFDGKRWLTPDSPLLAGTCRARLLAEGIIVEAKIGLADLARFHSFSLLNALKGEADLLDPLPIKNILK